MAANERIIIWAVLVFKKKNVFIIIIIIILPYMGLTVNRAWLFEQILNLFDES